MTLKTLNEIDLSEDDKQGGHIDTIIKRLLKREAIKHIKAKIHRIEEHSHNKFDGNGPYIDCLQCRNYFVRIQWIKHFFNIKDEDLKE